MTISSDNKRFLILAVLLGLTMLFGLPGVVDRLVHEHAGSALGHSVTWGLWAAAYTFFSGASAGAFLVGSLAFVFGLRRFEPLARMALFTALITLCAAMLFIVADLGRAERLMGVVLHANLGSTMAWMVYFYSIYTAIVLVMLLITLRPEWARKAAVNPKGRLLGLLSMGCRLSREASKKRERMLMILGSIGIPFAICLPAGVGTLFAAVRAQPYWNSGALPVAATLSAVTSGGALMIALSIFVIHGGEAFRRTMYFLGRMVAIVLLFEALVSFSEIMVIFRSGAPHEAVVLKSITTGPYSFVFWGGQVLIGTAIPLFILFRRSVSLRGAAFASFAILIGVFSFRLNLVIPQLTHAGFDGSSIDDPGLRYATQYLPTAPEWGFLLFGLGLTGLVLLIGMRLLPLVPGNAAIQFDAALARDRAAALREAA